MKPFFAILILVMIVASSCENSRAVDQATKDNSHFELIGVKINDAFWSPKLKLWETKTVNDVFDKFEGKYNPKGTGLDDDFKELGMTRNAFVNFDLVARGKRKIGVHHGPPWYDGLVYQTIRGAADLLLINPNPQLENRIDAYVDRVAKAQASEPDGYIDTYTQLMDPRQRWGFNGGMLRWQHDVYNAGMLVESGVHYYRATGKTKLLNIAVRMANYMCKEIGPAPRKNVVPAHSGPEESFLKLYNLFKHQPDLKKRMDVEVDESNYFELSKFWIEARGHHVGLPHWNTWGNEKSEKWIRDNKYDDPTLGEHRRPSWGDYAQDSVPVLQQKIIVGHAVRATLLATGVAAMAKENNDSLYINAATSLWDNMVGKRMFVTGGVGAIADDEKFGDDYYLPNDAYLETCAAVGVGFFSQKMNALTGKGKYMDELERTLYNGVLTGISLNGDNYTYQNPLVSEHHHRWEWHGCPCCPPMFLKIMGAIPEFIYSTSTDGVSVNLFVGSDAEVKIDDEKIHLRQETSYPWSGDVTVHVDLEHEKEFKIRLRIPGWAAGTENPLGLYHSQVGAATQLTVNGKVINESTVDGYITLDRRWAKGDKIGLKLPIQPRLVYANDKVQNLNNRVAIASGPLVYCFESSQNANLNKLEINSQSSGELKYQPDLLNGVNIINFKTSSGDYMAVPYYAVGNLRSGESYKVWVPLLKP